MYSLLCNLLTKQETRWLQNTDLSTAAVLGIIDSKCNYNQLTKFLVASFNILSYVRLLLSKFQLLQSYLQPLFLCASICASICALPPTSHPSSLVLMTAYIEETKFCSIAPIAS
jgi:hypothetical protein